MALGNLTRQIATQALNEQVNNVLDVLRPSEPAKTQETTRADKPAQPATTENLGALIVGEIQTMQKALKDDQELHVSIHTGVEFLRVLDIYVPSPQVVVLTGLDTERNITRLISPAHSLQLICKVMKVKPDAKPTRINFISPKP